MHAVEDGLLSGVLLFSRGSRQRLVSLLLLVALVCLCRYYDAVTIVTNKRGPTRAVTRRGALFSFGDSS